jgi:hypothetical protein
MAIKTFQPYVDNTVDPHVRTLFNLVFNKINNHALAISAATKKTGTITEKTIIESGSSGGGGGGGIGGVIFGVNNQTGQTAYATTSSDDGVFLILSDAAPIAVSLNSGVPAPFGLFVLNQGAGTATLTPTSGTLNGAASLTLLGGYCVVIAFDGGNWWGFTQPIVPVSFTSPAHQFVVSYNAATGVFASAQPAFSDISGNLTEAQLPTTGVSGTIHLGPLTSGGTPGSITVSHGIITGFVDPT